MGRPKIDKDHAERLAWSVLLTWKRMNSKKYSDLATLPELMGSDQSPKPRKAKA